MSHEAEDLTIKQEWAIAALLSCQSVAQTAKLALVGERSIFRWLKQDAFQSHLRRARRQALSGVLGRLQQVADRAVDTLDAILQNEQATTASRVSAVQAALRYACHGIEIDDFEERLAVVERVQKTNKESAA